VALHDLLADCKPYARAGILSLAMQPLKDDEDPLGVLRIYADAG
jgi:hypothetical protein